MATGRVSVIATPLHPLVIVARLVFAVFAYLLVQIVVVAVVYVGAYLVTGVASSPARADAWAMLGLAVVDGAALITVLLTWKLVDRRILATLGLRTERALKRWLRGAAVGALMMSTVVFAWYIAVDGAAWSPNPDPRLASFAVIAGFIGFLVQGAAEEVLFRGYVFENVRGRWGISWGISVSALIFGLFHLSNPGFGALPFINLVLFGVAMALWKVRMDGSQVWGVCAIHSVWNWLQQVVYGLPNSGMTSPPEDTLLTVLPNMTLPSVISGGTFGPEGSLGTTIVLSVMIVALMRKKWPSPAAARKTARA